MATLEELREKLDGIDDQIAKLYEERMKVCEDVGRFKVGAGRKVFDRQREHEKLLDVASKVNGEFNKKGIQELYAQLMSMSRKLQYQQLVEAGALGRLPFIEMESLDKQNVRVVFQGVEGAYSQAAMKKYFPDNENNFHVTTFREAMEAMEEGAADFAVLPIENSSAGIVADNYDLLVNFENYIVGEQIVKCQHALLGLPGAKLSDIKTVYSHSQALAQCEEYLDRHPEWRKVPYDNTALAAKKIAEEGDKTQAAVASKFAAQVFGLDVLEEHIYYNEKNSTRFIVVTNQRIFRKDATKISICFETPHSSGSLYNVLSHIIYNGLNMNKVESRPIYGRNWEYRFFVDFEGNLNDSAVKNALRGIREEAINMKILGNY